MGTVYRAHDPTLNRDVALTFTPFSEAFVHHEARAMARIRDPRVVTVHEVVARPYIRRRGALEQSLGTGYLVMEWIDGVALRHHSTSAEDVLRVLFDIAQAIHAVHTAGVVQFAPNSVISGSLSAASSKAPRRVVARPATRPPKSCVAAHRR